MSEAIIDIEEIPPQPSTEMGDQVEQSTKVANSNKRKRPKRNLSKIVDTLSSIPSNDDFLRKTDQMCVYAGLVRDVLQSKTSNHTAIRPEVLIKHEADAAYARTRFSEVEAEVNIKVEARPDDFLLLTDSDQSALLLHEFRKSWNDIIALLEPNEEEAGLKKQITHLKSVVKNHGPVPTQPLVDCDIKQRGFAPFKFAKDNYGPWIEAGLMTVADLEALHLGITIKIKGVGSNNREKRKRAETRNNTEYDAGTYGFEKQSDYFPSKSEANNNKKFLTASTEEIVVLIKKQKMRDAIKEAYKLQK